MSRLVRFIISIVTFALAVPALSYLFGILAFVITGVGAGVITREPGIYFLDEQPAVVVPGIVVAVIVALVCAFLLAKVMPALIYTSTQLWGRKTAPSL